MKALDVPQGQGKVNGERLHLGPALNSTLKARFTRLRDSTRAIKTSELRRKQTFANSPEWGIFRS